MNQHSREQIFRRFKRANPRPTTELHYKTPFQLMVAVVLSAQSTDKGVNKATAKLFQVAPTAASMLKLGEAKLKRHIQTIGLFNTKARNIIKASAALVDKHGGRIPHDRAALEALPGVGRKTANVILNIAFGEATIAVDTHILRVANRTGIAPGKTPLAVEKELMTVVPDKYKHDAHHWLILHGRYVCKARKPLCGECLIADLCEYDFKTVASSK